MKVPNRLARAFINHKKYLTFQKYLSHNGLIVSLKCITIKSIIKNCFLTFEQILDESGKKSFATKKNKMKIKIF